MAAGLVKPKTALTGMISPAAAVIGAMSKGKKKKPAALTPSADNVGTVGPSPSMSYGG